MTWDSMADDWTGNQSKVRQRWSKLTDEDLRRIQGRREELAQLIAERYGVEQDQAESEIDEFEQSDAFEENDEIETTGDGRGESRRGDQSSMDQSSKSGQSGRSGAAGESGQKSRSGPGSDASRETTGKSSDDEDEALNQPRRGSQETGRSGGMRSEP